MNAILPLPDADCVVERLKAARARFLQAVARELESVHLHGEHAEAVRDWLEAAENTVHDHLDPAIAMMQRRADEAAGELEAAHVAAERAELRAGSGVRWGRG